MKVHTSFLIIAAFAWVFVGSAFAVSNTALQFDGVNDFAAVPDGDALSPQIAGEMTFSGWVKISALPVGNNMTFLTKGTPNNYEYDMGIITDGTVCFTLWRPSGSHFATAIGGTITPGQWHNVTGTYKENEYIKVYLDGQLVGQSNSFNPSIAAGSGQVYFGKTDNSSGPSWFKGALDEVQLWDYAKTDAQVLQSLNVPLAGSESGLVAYWNFNEGNGQTLTDLTGHGHNGRLGTLSTSDSADPTWVAGVPEPATMALLGLGGLLLRRRRAGL